MEIKFNMRGAAGLNDFLKSLPRGSMRSALEAMAKYFIGNKSRGLKHAEAYKYVTRASAYGFSFFTDRQRRWFFAALNSGELKIGNNRTGASGDAWGYTVNASGYQYKLTNNTTAAFYTRSDAGQARQPAKVGWRKVSKVIADNMAGAMQAARAAVRNFIATKKV
jgi:hypothetical protein